MSNNPSAQKVLIIGLDCADPVLMFDKFIDRLPNIRSLTQRGLYGRMESCTPPITVPAWTCMATSKDPGQLGCYGFRNRADWSYDKLTFATNANIDQERIWDIIGRDDKASVILGVPQTYPPNPINGSMVSCFLTPSTESNYTYPVELKAEIEQVVGQYIIDVHGYRTNNKPWLLDQIYRMTEQRFKLARHLMTAKDWQLFWMVDMGTDRLHHGFWQFMDRQHHRYVSGNQFENTIEEYYIYIDQQIGKLLELVDLRTTAVWIVSDHGAKTMVGGLCFNDWLIKQGYLKLVDRPQQVTRFAEVQIDWPATRAWGEGGYYGRSFMNVANRESAGSIGQDHYEEFRDQLADQLQAMTDHNGQAMGTKAYKPQDIYRQVRGVPPDLIVLFGDLNWRSIGSVGNPEIYTFENDTGPDDANHAMQGMFICAGPGTDIKGTGQNRQISIYDFAPSVLEQFGIEKPPDMIGKSIFK